MQRTKALGLLHKQIRADSTMNRQGIPDYLVTMRAPGKNAEPVSHTTEQFPVEKWQRYASPVWATAGGIDDEGMLKFMSPTADNADKCGIDQGDTLQHRSARDNEDEKHICPLQLEVIRRGVELWTNPGDTVLSPFMGIGSEGYVSLQSGRKFVGAELKPSYYAQAVKNLASATSQGLLF
jgi:DNA modification methylase